MSVLFADLVGFTTLSEATRPRGGRASCWRATSTLARTLIGRYGGTVEKFIGDAVMAVWGTPVAHEDDAERAVRAALDLVPRSPRSARRGLPSCGAGRRPHRRGRRDPRRRGPGHGRRRSRQHRLADPVGRRAGHRLVGEATRRAPRGGDRLRAAGEHELKGKAEPVALWRAAALVAGRRRALRGRRPRGAVRRPRPELRLVKELFHATAEEPGARLVSVVGLAGIGKSRLGWEFYKYIDGLAERVLVAPRPLPPLRRGRRLLGARPRWCACAPDRRGRGAASRRARSCARRRRARGRRPRSALHRAAARAAARARGGRAGRPEDLFAAWRLLFERLADRARWCSSSRTCSGRTRACSTSSSTCSSGRRNIRSSSSRWPGPSCTSAGHAGAPGARLHVPLPRAARRRAMAALLDGLVPGLPEQLREQISRGPRGCRCTPSRRCGCCSTAGCSRAGRRRLHGRRGDRDARGARDAARADRRPPRRPRPRRSGELAAGRRRARQDVHAARRWRRSPATRRPSSSRC